MLTHKAEIRATAVKLTQRAEECFERAGAQHDSADLQQESADLQHANAEKLEVLGTGLISDAAELFGETDLQEGPAKRTALVPDALAPPARPNRTA